MSNSLQSHGLWPHQAPLPMRFTGVVSHFLLQRIFPWLMPCLLHCRQILLPLSHWRSPFYGVETGKPKLQGSPAPQPPNPPESQFTGIPLCPCTLHLQTPLGLGMCWIQPLTPTGLCMCLLCSSLQRLDWAKRIKGWVDENKGQPMQKWS